MAQVTRRKSHEAGHVVQKSRGAGHVTQKSRGAGHEAQKVTMRRSRGASHVAPSRGASHEAQVTRRGRRAGTWPAMRKASSPVALPGRESLSQRMSERVHTLRVCVRACMCVRARTCYVHVLCACVCVCTGRGRRRSRPAPAAAGTDLIHTHTIPCARAHTHTQQMRGWFRAGCRRCGGLFCGGPRGSARGVRRAVTARGGEARG